jgi:hypothetical protein
MSRTIQEENDALVQGAFDRLQELHSWGPTSG